MTATWIKNASRKKRKRWLVLTSEAKQKFKELPFDEWYGKFYLRCRWWRDFRSRTIKSRGDMCEECHSREGLRLHHNSYERLFEELPEDVTVLCLKCHRGRHGGHRG